MPVYVIANVTILNQEKYNEYLAAGGGTLAVLGVVLHILVETDQIRAMFGEGVEETTNDTLRIVCYILYGVGGAAIATGVWLWIVKKKNKSKTTTTVLSTLNQHKLSPVVVSNPFNSGVIVYPLQ